MMTLTTVQLHRLHDICDAFRMDVEMENDRIERQTAACRARLLEAAPLADSPARRRYEMIRERKAT